LKDQIPEPMETQLRKASEDRHFFPPASFLTVTLSSLLLDLILLAGGWVTGSPTRIALILVGIDAVLLGLWAVTIPLRRWLARLPY
jgi:uncharacterized membrane protein YjjP (DUF1212 family)